MSCRRWEVKIPELWPLDYGYQTHPTFSKAAVLDQALIAPHKQNKGGLDWRQLSVLAALKAFGPLGGAVAQSTKPIRAGVPLSF